MKTFLTILFLTLLTVSNGQTDHSQRKSADSIIAERQNLLFNFLNISLQDKVADIGTGDGFNLIPIANRYPTLTFTAEDIDSKYCNKELLAKRIKKSGDITKIENINIQIGTEKTTNLPTNSFNKVLLFDVVHEMTFKPEMLADIKRILTKGGNMYIQEILVHKKVKKDKVCNYPYLTGDALKVLLQDNKITINKEQMFFDTGHNKYIKLFECSFMNYPDALHRYWQKRAD